MSLTFYRAPNSTAGVTDLVFAELGVPHETVTLDLTKGDTKSAEHLTRDPNGRVPVVIHDGTPIWESAAITIYLGEVFGTEKGLWPAPGPKRGEAMRWVVWTNATLGEAVGRWVRNTMPWTPEEQRNAKAGDAGKKDLERCLGILDEALESRPFLVGEFTLADAHLRALMSWLEHLQVDLSPYPRLGAWARRCAERPAFAQLARA
jgi:glutathione S-transferase